MRSCCLRVRQERIRGPKSLKVNEYTTQLFQYGPDWRLHARDFLKFFERTFELLIKSDKLIASMVLLLPQVPIHDKVYFVQTTELLKKNA